MPRITDLVQHHGDDVLVEATVTGIRLARYHKGRKESAVVTLADCTGGISLLVAFSMEPQLTKLHIGAVIQASVRISVHEWGAGGLLIGWQCLSDDCVGNRLAVIPRSACPSHACEALVSLAAGVDKLSSTVIRRAANELVGPLCLPLVSASASREHHHSEAGGLLVHTEEVFSAARAEAIQVFKDDPVRVDLVCLTALLHDLAKAEVQAWADHKPNALIAGLWHGLGAIALAAPALRRLADQMPDVGYRLGEILRWMSSPPTQRRWGQCPEAEIVLAADHRSVRRYQWRGAPISEMANSPEYIAHDAA